MRALGWFFLCCLFCVASWGQVPMPTAGEGQPVEEGTAEPAETGPRTDELRSPRATMRAFVASVEMLLDSEPRTHRLRTGQDPTVILRRTLGLDPTVDANSARDIGIRLYSVLHRIDDFSGQSLGTLFDLADLSAIEADGKALPDRVQIWPWGGLLSPAGADTPDGMSFVNPQRNRALERAFDARGVDAEIALIRTLDDDRWIFSPETLRETDAMFDALRALPQPFGVQTDGATVSLWIESYLPSWALQKDFTLRNWQWLGLALVIFAGFAADLVSRTALFAVWVRYRTSRHRRGNSDAKAEPPDFSVGKRTVRPFGLLVGATVWYWSVAALGLPPLWATVLQLAARVVLTLAGILAAWRVTDVVGLLVLNRTSKASGQIDDLLVPLLRKTLKILVVIFGMVYVAKSLSLDIGPVLAGLGVGGLAFAFAAKDTIENLFGSVAVILDRPFQVGDWVYVDGTEGTVEDLGLRSTRIRTFYNSQVTVPNAALVRAVVDNYGRRRYRRYKTTLNVTYDTPPDSIEAFCEGIRELIRLHPYTRRDQFHVWMNDFGPHSLDILVYMFFECPEWGTELRERHRFILDIVRLANKLGVEFAFPTQTLHVHESGATPDSAEIGDLAIDTERRARRTGLKAAQAMTKDAVWRDVKPAPVAFSADRADTTDDLADDGDDGDGGR
ncbi:MAG: mechanosensitive ion channel family protein [Planctomycetota bacterium]